MRNYSCLHMGKHFECSFKCLHYSQKYIIVISHVILSIYVMVCVITGKENLIQTLIDLFPQPFSYGNHENSHPLLHVYDARNSLYSIHYYQKKLFFDLFIKEILNKLLSFSFRNRVHSAKKWVNNCPPPPPPFTYAPAWSCFLNGCQMSIVTALEKISY